MANAQIAKGFTDNPGLGVVTGLIVRDPGSSTLTTVLEGGWIRIKSPTSGEAFNEFRIADTSRAYTASRDTYVYVSATGTLGYIEQTLNDPKPSLAALETAGGVGAQFIAKVVTDGSRIVAGGVTDLRQLSGAFLLSQNLTLSFATNELGAQYWVAPTRSRIWKAQASVQVALAGTDAGSITLARGVNDVYTNMTDGAISLAASSAIGTRASCLPSASFIVEAGQAVRFTTAKATAGGRTVTQVLYEPV